MPAAETQKRQIEQLQRDRRRVMEENNIAHQARFFRSGAKRDPGGVPGLDCGAHGGASGALREWGRPPPIGVSVAPQL